MAFPHDDLDEDEELVLDERPHWLFVFWPATALAIATLAVLGWLVVLVFGDSWAISPQGALLLGMFLVLPWLVAASLSWQRIVRWRYIRYVVTSRRLIFRSGVLRRYKRDIPLRRVQDIHLDQSILARLVRAGDLTIETAGNESAISLDWMPAAEQVRRKVYTLALESRRDARPEDDSA